MKKRKFKPKLGQIDFTKARWAPVINCVVKYQDKILIIKRSKDLNLYPNCWNGISGFLDDKRSLEQKVEDELREEIGLKPRDIKSIKLGVIFHQEEAKYKKTWIVHPILVEVKTNKIKLDWEAEDYKCIKVKEVKHFNLLPGLNRVLESFFRN